MAFVRAGRVVAEAAQVAEKRALAEGRVAGRACRQPVLSPQSSVHRFLSDVGVFRKGLPTCDAAPGLAAGGPLAGARAVGEGGRAVEDLGRLQHEGCVASVVTQHLDARRSCKKTRSALFRSPGLLGIFGRA